MKINPLRVALRADASPLIGFGHVKRCLSLAIALRELGFEPRLITRPLSADSAGMARDAGVEVLLLPQPPAAAPQADPVPHAAWAGVNWRDDAAQTAAALAPWAPAWVVVDHYAFDTRWQRHVAGTCNTRIAVIDDLADRALDGQLLLDQNLNANHREKYRGRWPADRTLLGGPRYALLGPAYAGLPPLAIRETVHSIGIFMGGADAAGLSGLALRACREVAGFVGPVEVVATRAQTRFSELTELARQWPGTDVLCDLTNLVGFFSRHDLQIGAGGGATWERCSIGAPTLVLPGAGNQQAVIPALVEDGAVAALDPCEPLNAASVGRAVRALIDNPQRRRALSERGRKLVDGVGATRVALTLAADTLALRRANTEDAEPVFHWRNHPDTLRFFRDPRPFELEAHCRWWERTLALPERRLFIAHIGRRDVGVLRLDLEGDAAEVSIYVDPALPGLGLGRAMLRAAQQLAAHGTSASVRLEAEILSGNQASERAFGQAGFTARGQRWVWEP